MIMCMSDGFYEKALVVTNRHLCRRPFLEQIDWLARQRPAGILLREKDLQPEEYERLATDVLSICERRQVPCTLHFYPEVARNLGVSRIHLPLWKLEREDVSDFSWIGASVHSGPEAVKAQRLGATYVTAGHVFATDCKRGLPPRGLEFLREVCLSVQIPVYGIGGINQNNCGQVLEQQAAGYCLMSSAMRAK